MVLLGRLVHKAHRIELTGGSLLLPRQTPQNSLTRNHTGGAS